MQGYSARHQESLGLPLDTAAQMQAASGHEPATEPFPEFAWMEITGTCNLRCVHCLTSSGPNVPQGTLEDRDWLRTIDEFADEGGQRLQFIGGEPTLHRSLPAFVARSLQRGLDVEVFSNLTHIAPGMWDVLRQERVSVATSYYSASSRQHEAITTVRGSRDRTRGNIERALELGIPLRVGIIGVLATQAIQEAEAELRSLGVERIGSDRVRQVGRGQDDKINDIAELCGGCVRGVVAVMSDGNVQPCVFSRWDDVVYGNLRDGSLRQTLDSPVAQGVRDRLRREFDSRRDSPRLPDAAKCKPNEEGCSPDDACNPDYEKCRPDDWCEPRCWPTKE